MKTKSTLTLSKVIIYTLFSLLIFTLCCLPAFLKIGVGAFSFDEPYQILNGLNYRSMPVAPLSAYLTNILGEVFNWKWLYFRTFALSVNVLCILGSGLFLLWYVRNYFLFLAVTSVSLLVGTLFPEAHNLYGWDTWTELLLIFSLILILKNLLDGTFLRYNLIIILGILSALIILVRIPNILVCAVILLIIVFFPSTKDKKLQNHKLGLCLIYASSIVVSGFVFLSLLYGSPSQYLHELTSRAVGAHGTSALIGSIYIGILNTIPIIFFFWGCYLTIRYCIKNNRKFLALIVLIALCWCIRYELYESHTIFFQNVKRYEAAFWFFIAFLILYYNRCHILSKNWIAVITVVCFASIPFIGSNTELNKTLVWSTAPLLCCFLAPYFTKALRCLCYIFVIAVLIYAYRGLQMSSYGDEGLNNATQRFERGHFEGIVTTKSKWKYVNEFINDMNKYSGSEIIVISRMNDYIYDYSVLSRNDFSASMLDNEKYYDDPAYVEWLNKGIDKDRGDKKLIIAYFYPFANNNGSQNKEDNAITKLLDSKLNREVEKDRYIIYSK